jgi:hypothetical protein
MLPYDRDRASRVYLLFFVLHSFTINVAAERFRLSLSLRLCLPDAVSTSRPGITVLFLYFCL